jgi:glycine cleavage system regulatory protein
MSADSKATTNQRPLPALYLSCAEQLPSNNAGTSLLDRLLDTRLPPQGIVFITLQPDLASPQLASPQTSDLVNEIQQLLDQQGLHMALSPQLNPRIQRLQHELFKQPPGTCIELQLNTGLSARAYRQLGQSLQQLRNQGILLICLDRTPDQHNRDEYHPPHDAYWRDLIQQWVAEQQWQHAIKLADAHSEQTGSADALISDASLCLMHAAFALGGLCQPQRFFGYGLDDQTRALAGFGWMR